MVPVMKVSNNNIGRLRIFVRATDESMDLFGAGPIISSEESIGEGASGQTFRFVENRKDGRPRRFAVKTALGEDRNREVLREIYWLNVGRGLSRLVCDYHHA